MKVMMLIERYSPIWGGAERQLEQLISHLRENSIDCSVITRRWKRSFKKHEIISGADVFRVGLPGNSILSTLSYIFSTLYFLLFNRKAEWDIAHTHGAAALGVLGTLAANIQNKNCVVKIATAGKIPALSSTFYGRLLLKYVTNASKYIALSNEIKNEMLNININNDRIVRICNGVDTSLYSPASHEKKQIIRNRLDIPNECTMVSFCGRIVNRKGLDLALKAWKTIENSHDNVFLYIAGSGDMQKDSNEEECRQYVEQNSLHSVVFLGDVDDIPSLLQASDIFIFPSRVEGMPNSLLEALSSGLPVVASDIGGVNDIVTHEETGLLFEKENIDDFTYQVKRLITDSSLIDELGENSRKQIKDNFSLNKISETYKSLYESLKQ